MYEHRPVFRQIRRWFNILMSVTAPRCQRRRTRSAVGGEILESRQLLTASFGFDYGVIASDLSPTLRFFSPPNTSGTPTSDGPFTILRYGEGQVTSLHELGVGYLEPIDLTFQFGSNDQTAPVEAVTLAEFDNGLADGIVNQIYRPDADDQPKMTIYNAGVAVVEGRVQEISLAMPQQGGVTSARSTFVIERAVGSDTRLYDELVAASQGTNVIPFSLTEFDIVGPWAGVGDAMIFQSTGVSLFTAPTNHAPTDISLSHNSIAENQPVGTAVGVLTTTDPDGSGAFTYSLVTGAGSTDNVNFTISGDRLKTNTAFDFETKSSYSVRLQTRDPGGLTFQKQFTIDVGNLAEGTAETTLSNSTISESGPAGAVVGFFSTTGAGTFVYTLESGEGDDDNRQFKIDRSYLVIAAKFDYEAKSTYSICVQTTGSGVLSFKTKFTIDVANVAEINLSETSIQENKPIGAVVGVLSPMSADINTIARYELVAGIGDTDNDRFTVIGSKLRTAEIFNYEENSSFSVRITGKNFNGVAIRTEIFTITVTDLLENATGPTEIQLSSSTIDENRPAEAVVGTFSSSDPNGGAFRYELVSPPKRGWGTAPPTDNSQFFISGNQLQAISPFDFETKSSYRIYVRSTDETDLYREQSFTIRVNNVNEAPTEIVIPPDLTVLENRIGAQFQLRATDPDDDETFQWSLAAGQGDTNNALFSITSSGKLALTFIPDYEQKNSYTVRVRVTDSANNILEKVLTIGVRDVQEEDEYLVGDWNGDGKDTLAVRRGNQIIYQPQIDSAQGISVTFGNGNSEDQYLVGDWNGDGKDTLAVRRGNQIFYQSSITSTTGTRVVYGNGNAEDQYLVGDWNGDRKDTLAVRRGNQIFYQANITSTTGTRVVYGNGNAEDQYLVGDWDGDRKDTLAVRRGNQIFYQARLNSTTGSRADFGNGNSESQYLVGDWDGNRRNTPAVRRGNSLFYQLKTTSLRVIMVTYGNG